MDETNRRGRPKSRLEEPAVQQTIREFDARHRGKASARRHIDHVERTHGFRVSNPTMLRKLKEIRNGCGVTVVSEASPATE